MMSKRFFIAVLLAMALAVAGPVQAQEKAKGKGKKGGKKKAAAEQAAPGAPGAPAKPPATGYMDTPLIPGTQWHIHDDTRERPAVIAPAETVGQPPSDAVVLFSGKDEEVGANWQDDKGQPTKWKVNDGALECVPKSGYIVSKKTFGDIQLHLEFACPTPPKGDSQGRGNSGVFFGGGKYEIQLLDSYDNKSYADGQCGAIYGQHPPLVNACRKPGEWQSYDFIYHMPCFEGGKAVKPATVTVFQNGILLHEKSELFGGTSHKKIVPYAPHAEAPLKLQDHGNPVRYRNIWVRELDQYENSPTQLDKK